VTERLFWLVKLRWIAAAGVVLTVFIADHILGIRLPAYILYSAILFLASYNLLIYIILVSINKRKVELSVYSDWLANLQISLDLLILAVCIHFSGGIENLFIFYFIFHAIIASILLSRRAAFLQATFTVFLFLLIVSLEYLGIMPHYPLSGFITAVLYNNLLYVVEISFVFISTIYIAVYMATSVANRLKTVNQLLKEKDRIKSEYVLRVTHDIKEHLSAIQGCIDPVASEICGPLAEQQKNLLNRASRRTLKLLFFVRALLDITKLKLTRELKAEVLHLSDIIEPLLEDARVRAHEKNVAFEVVLPEFLGCINGVGIYLEAALSNLLVNACKYTLAGGKITFVVEDQGDNYQIKIIDTGIGIPKDDLPCIFEEFHRAKNAQAIEKMGTGLGLAMSKEVVEMHQGKIWVESREGEGTTFFVSLPKRT